MDISELKESLECSRIISNRSYSCFCCWFFFFTPFPLTANTAILEGLLRDHYHEVLHDNKLLGRIIIESFEYFNIFMKINKWYFVCFIYYLQPTVEHASYWWCSVFCGLFVSASVRERVNVAFSFLSISIQK